MSDGNKKIGAIEWRDLTVDNAVEVSDFYAEVVGWQKQALPMGDYDDFCMNLPNDGETIAGVCHARGDNSELPPQWLMYVRVSDANASAEKVVALGGEIIKGPTVMQGETYYVIRDPAGAVLAIHS